MSYTRAIKKMLASSTVEKRHVVSRSKSVIFTPGMLCDQRLWQPTFQLMPEIEKHFIDFTDCNDINAYSQKIAQHKKSDASMVGFSMGGYIAIEHVLQSKQKPSALILISTSARGYTPSEIQQRKRMIELASEAFQEFISPKRLMNWVDKQNENHHLIVALLKQMADTAGVETFIQQQTATLHRLDRRELLKNIVDIPVLIIHGANDKLIPASYAEELASQIPNATCKIIDHCGHMVPLEKPNELANILSTWLNDHNLISRNANMQTAKTTDVYTLRRGKAGEERLNVLNDIYNKDSEAFLINQGIMNAKKVLDVGCGTGQMACWIAKTNPNCHVTCVDISVEQLAVAEERSKAEGLTNMSFKQCSAYELENLNQQFDFIYTRFVLAHIQYPLKALQSMQAILAPNGKLACEEAKTSEHYCSPNNPAFNRYYEIWSGIRRLKGADPELGPKLAELYEMAGLSQITTKLVTRDLPLGERTRLIFGYNLNEIGDEAIKLQLTTEQELEELKTSIHQLIQRDDVTLRFSGSVQATGINQAFKPTLSK